MPERALARTVPWTTAVPPIALLVLGLSWGREPNTVLVVVIAVVLAAAVLSAVHHAEVVAHRVGEPFGSLVLAVAVTVIEVALIVTLMVSGGPETTTLARDTVFAAVMITCNGILGLSLLVGALRHQMTVFNAEGTGAALATVTTPSSGSPRWSPPRSRTPSPRSTSRSPSSESSSPCSCCCPRPLPPPTPPAATACRSASTSRSGQRWPASA
jgi:hypothetical protein